MNSHLRNLPRVLTSSKKRIPFSRIITLIIMFVMGAFILSIYYFLMLPSSRSINNLLTANDIKRHEKKGSLNPGIRANSIIDSKDGRRSWHSNSNVIGFDDDVRNHNHGLPKACIKDVTPMLFEEWREANETICTRKDMSVQTFTMKRWEYEPSFHVYRNIFLRSFDSTDNQPYDCQTLTRNAIENRRARDESDDGDAQTSAAVEIINQPVIRVKPWAPTNSYERFNAYLNVAFAMAMFNVTNPQIVYVVPEGSSEISRGDVEMYESFSSLKPIVLPYPRDEIASNNGMIFVPYMIDSSPSGTSMLVTKTHGGALRGREIDHHCKSSIFRGIVRWMTSNLLGIDYAPSEHDRDGNAETVRIVWSTRQQYCCKPKGKIYTPARNIVDEDELVRQVGRALGSKYKIATVNFGDLTTHESVKIASQSHMMVGVHGAGLVWSAFLRADPHAGLLEMFGGDRDSGNRHYHNIASLADIHYRSLSLEGKELWDPQSALVWDQPTVETIVTKIRSMDLRQEPSANDLHEEYSGDHFQLPWFG